MNDKKFAFIICVNDEIYFKECNRYISQLIVPEKYEIDVLVIRGADSLCAAYNEGIKETDAKYKIYMHQDVFIRNRYFLEDVLKRFLARPKVGMIGMVGGTNIPDTGIVFDTWNVGKVDVREPDMAYYMHTDDSIKEDMRVLAIDGMIMVTQYDLPWREDLFTHFDFYDVSQACEFRREGYEVLVPYQEIPWVIHDCGFAKLGNYVGDREIFLREYADMLTCHGERELLYEAEWESLSLQLEKHIEGMLNQGAWDEAEEVLKIYHQANFKSSGLEMISIMVKIHQAEVRSNCDNLFFDGRTDFAQMKEWYTNVRFAIRHVELAQKEEEYTDFAKLLADRKISFVAICILVQHAVINRASMFERLEKIYESSGDRQTKMQVEAVLEQVRKMGLPVSYSKGVKKV